VGADEAFGDVGAAERVVEAALGGTDGRGFFQSLAGWLS